MPLHSQGILVAVVFLLFGAAFLYRGTEGLDGSQGMMVIVGAVLISLSVTVAGLVVRSRLEWRRNYKKYREQ
jgi:hypothetical protein